MDLAELLLDIANKYVVEGNPESGDIFKTYKDKTYIIRANVKQAFYDDFSAVYENMYWDYIDSYDIPYKSSNHRNLYSRIWNEIRDEPPFNLILAMWKTIRRNISTAYVVFHDSVNFLAVIVKGRSGQMNLPGGKMELSDNNDLFETARRETKEELGLNIETYDNVYEHTFSNRVVVAFEIRYRWGGLPKDMSYSNELDGYLYIPWKMLNQKMVRNKFGSVQLKLLDRVHHKI